ncbi:phosphotransferase [Streptomyces sp. NPDC001027]|uniref:phosphotransferase family protein n=1 Tax=Streptomyces sp. NPDC001027 TaxID=3154771 RepID=UPI00332DEFA8
MTTTVSPESAARKACRDSGLSDRSLTRLHEHATAVYVLPAEGVVVRVSPVAHQRRLETAVSLTRWLVANGFPATEPSDISQPITNGPYVITFWKHYLQSGEGAPPAGPLGDLLRALHDLPPPPIDLPDYRPLASFNATLKASTFLTDDLRDWLTTRMTELLDSYEQLDFPLGHGHLHGDAYPGNTLRDGTAVRLGDWDEAARGPREIDLANTFQGVRFGRAEKELKDFTDRYGYDIREWPGLPVLCRIRDLHTLGSYIRRADRGDQAAAAELSHRIATLQEGADRARWTAR